MVSHRKISDSESNGMLNQLNNADSFGYGLCSMGDIDGNGVQDLAVGAPFREDVAGGVNQGGVWVMRILSTSSGAI